MATLEHLLAEFEKNDDPNGNLRKVLGTLPEVRQYLELAAERGNLNSLAYSNTLGSASGAYDADNKQLKLNTTLRDGLERNDPDAIVALSLVAAHEGSHASRGHEILAHTQTLRQDVSALVGSSNGRHDYTSLAMNHADFVLKEEAKAEIAGFNGAYAAILKYKTNGDPEDALRYMAEAGPGSLADNDISVALGTLSNYIGTKERSIGSLVIHDYALKDGIELGGQGLSDQNPAHLKFMKDHFSDRPFGEDIEKHKYYRHVAVGDVVRMAIGAGEPHGNIGLQLEALGTSREGLAPRFLSQSGHRVPVDFADLSNSPSVSNYAWPQWSDASDARHSNAETPSVLEKANTKKRGIEVLGDAIEPAPDNTKKVKFFIDPALVKDAERCLSSQTCQDKLGRLRLSDTELTQLTLGCAVAAQNNGFKQIGEITFGYGGKAFVLNGPSDNPSSDRLQVNAITLAQTDKGGHMNALTRSPAREEQVLQGQTQSVAQMK